MNPNNQQFIKGAIITIIIAAILGTLIVMGGDMLGWGEGNFAGKLFLISFSLIFFGLTATISLVVAEKPQYKNMGNAGMIVSAAAFFCVLILIFTGVDNDLTIAKITSALFILSIALAHICLLHHFNLRNKYAHTARLIATIFISLFSLVIIINIFSTGDGLQSLMNGQSTIKMVMASLIIDLAATLLVPLCNRLEVKEPVEELTISVEPPVTSDETQQ